MGLRPSFDRKHAAGGDTEFPVTAGSGPLAITASPEGNMWFTESDANRIGRITPSGVVLPMPEAALPANLGVRW